MPCKDAAPRVLQNQTPGRLWFGGERGDEVCSRSCPFGEAWGEEEREKGKRQEGSLREGPGPVGDAQQPRADPAGRGPRIRPRTRGVRLAFRGAGVLESCVLGTRVPAPLPAVSGEQQALGSRPGAPCSSHLCPLPPGRTCVSITASLFAPRLHRYFQGWLLGQETGPEDEV